ncbi:metallophosphoesterase [Oceanobacillus massiliensis]|uniref:metallophosphoesterase n=1 Tax=Oceanobacillus massiliensis TaxID=1465765 RepID=UPI00301A7129
MIDIRKLDLDKTKRIIVISDIHANLQLFEKLLDKVNYSDDDYLFINGDLCEKGPNSLDVIRYVRSLSNSSERVFVTKGNCDVVFRYVLEVEEGIINYMNNRQYSFLNEMLAVHDKTLDDFTGLEELAAYYRKYFHSELEWLESLPIAYETDEHIMIHAGIDESWPNMEESVALYTPSFYEQGHHAGKTVIVGHWPVVNYRSAQASSHNPLIDFDKQVIALDGGNQIKRDGQLNALIIEDGDYFYTYVDELSEESFVSKGHIDTTGRIGTVTYPNYEVKIIRQEEFFSLCENSKLGLQQWVKNEYLRAKDEQVYCTDDLSTTFLSVGLDEKVWILDDECAGYTLIKKVNGTVGWIPKECI